MIKHHLYHYIRIAKLDHYSTLHGSSFLSLSTLTDKGSHRNETLVDTSSVLLYLNDLLASKTTIDLFV
jgi:hypothetical protein